MVVNDRRSLTDKRVRLERNARSRAFADAIRAGVDVDAVGHILAMDRLGAELNLIFEIGCCRLMLMRLYEVDAIDARDPGEFAAVVRKLTAAMTRAVELQKQIALEGGSNTSEALTSLLIELGGSDAS